MSCFGRMQCESVSADTASVVCKPRACGGPSVQPGHPPVQPGHPPAQPGHPPVQPGHPPAQPGHRPIDARIVFGDNTIVGTAIVHSLSRHGRFAEASAIFGLLRHRDLAAWNAAIGGFTLCGHAPVAFACFDRMQCEAQLPNPVTMLCALKACVAMGALEKGERVHSRVYGGPRPIADKVGAALVDMYAKCGALGPAERAFREIRAPNVVSWTALIGGYVRNGQAGEALACFERMQREGVRPNSVTYVCALKACGSLGSPDAAETMHRAVAREGLLAKSALVGNALVGMYVGCGRLERAREAFDELRVRDAVAWNVIMAGFARQSFSQEAIDFSLQMRHEGLVPDRCTFLCVLSACGSLGTIGRGEEAHGEIVCRGLMEDEAAVGNALVDMYAKCGTMSRAQHVFDRLPARSVVSWTGLISGYARLGDDSTAAELFEKMIHGGVRPNDITFTTMLNAFRHSGTLQRGDACFDTMQMWYGVVPSVEHHACIVDLFGRAGQFDHAVALLESMPISHYCGPIWVTLLGACRKWRNPAMPGKATCGDDMDDGGEVNSRLC